jgi:transposase
LLADGRLPEAWIPPAHVQQWRTRTRLRKTLVDERSDWLYRIQATLFHYGVPAEAVPRRLLSAEGRRALAALALPEAAQQRIEVALALIDAIDAQLAPLERELRALARRQPGCRALQRHFGIGELTAPTILVELGDVTRLSASRKAVRAVGLDIGVHRSDRHSRLGRLTRQGPPEARWALYEAAQSACRRTSPDPCGSTLPTITSPTPTSWTQLSPGIRQAIGAIPAPTTSSTSRSRRAASRTPRPR